MTSTGVSVAEDVRSILRDVLQLGARAQSLHVDSPLLGAVPELDSMAVVSVVTAIEDRFDTRFEDNEITADIFATFGTLCDVVAGKTSS